MKVLGIMSGTSIDGIDYALCDVDAKSIRLIQLWSREFPNTIRRRLHAAAADACGAHELAQLHHDLGRLYARQATALRAGAELVGLHGQTVFHNPDRRAPATLQLGEPAYLAETLRVPIVSNFRSADIAAGGQGAPLATLFHKVAFARRGRHVCVNNLGGISNVTSIDWRHGAQPGMTAFDTGPANVLIDLAMREFTGDKKWCDTGGAWARRGTANEKLLSRWLRHPFFPERPPKSTGRELFGETFWRAEQGRLRAAKLSRFDILATLTEFTARSIAFNYWLHLPAAPDTVVLCGGGAKNPFLVKRIAAVIHDTDATVQVCTSEALGWPVESIEAAAFALLAFYRWKEKPANIPETTGATHEALLGQLTLPAPN
jgi:anhydro-N-acetylmuramic acid kinase